VNIADLITNLQISDGLIGQARQRDSSLPISTMTSKIPGETVRPVRAARSGCATLPSLRPRASAKARAAASMAGPTSH
jgi:hypothetical protein